MPGKAKRTKVRAGLKSPLESMYGAQSLTASKIISAQTKSSKQWEREFREQEAREREIAKQYAPLNAALRDTLGKDERVAETVRGLRSLAKRHSGEKLPEPKVEPVEPREFLGSIGATVVPPFPAQYPWKATKGDPYVYTLPNGAAGTLQFNLGSNPDYYSSASAFVEIGFHLRPVTNGTLKLTSGPSFNYSWSTYCAFAPAHSDGWIGLRVDRYNLTSGALEGTPIAQKNYLWNHDYYWYGAVDSGSNSNYRLAAQLTVDTNHIYGIWVWCGGRIAAEGYHTVYTSSANSTMKVAVPFITWELV
ncbi:MAG: hypothetical protein H7Y30_15655 [Pyrinomonadaceae bacterium]|nr:hypothetical protein [Pyrinomonadaceae bacterium]